MHWLSLLYLLLRLLHVSAFICHLQGASFILMSYLKGRNGYVVVMYCKCWWPVCTGCCSFVCYVVQLSAYALSWCQRPVLIVCMEHFINLCHLFAMLWLPCVLEVWGIVLRFPAGEREFLLLQSDQRTLRLTQPPVQGLRDLLLGLKRPGRKVDNWPAFLFTLNCGDIPPLLHMPSWEYRNNCRFSTVVLFSGCWCYPNVAVYVKYMQRISCCFCFNITYYYVLLLLLFVLFSHRQNLDLIRCDSNIMLQHSVTVDGTQECMSL
jgi:hypothetical protein